MIKDFYQLTEDEREKEFEKIHKYLINKIPPRALVAYMFDWLVALEEEKIISIDWENKGCIWLPAKDPII